MCRLSFIPHHFCFRWLPYKEPHVTTSSLNLIKKQPFLKHKKTLQLLTLPVLGEVIRNNNPVQTNPSTYTASRSTIPLSPFPFGSLATCIQWGNWSSGTHQAAFALSLRQDYCWCSRKTFWIQLYPTNMYSKSPTPVPNNCFTDTPGVSTHTTFWIPGCVACSR